jgi:hypothetical protein
LMAKLSGKLREWYGQTRVSGKACLRMVSTN